MSAAAGGSWSTCPLTASAKPALGLSRHGSRRGDEFRHEAEVGRRGVSFPQQIELTSSTADAHTI
jgi:hypothetical protein